MSQHPKQKPTRVIRPNGHGDEYKHPAYGVATLSRVSTSGHKTLFGSSIKHHDFIEVRLHTATRVRNLNHEYYHGDKIIASFQMSAAQWGEFVSSFSLGGGVPVTLDYIPVEGTKLQECPEIDDDGVGDILKGEIKDDMTEALTKINAAIKGLDELLGKTPPTKGRLKEIQDLLKYGVASLPGHMEFAFDQFVEQMEHVVTDAKASVDAHIQSRIETSGIAALKGTVEMPKAIENRSGK